MFLVNQQDDYYTILGVTDDISEVLTIPDEIDNVPVKAIAANAFSGCQKLQEVWLPPHLQIIGTAAFRGCRHLKKVFVSGVSAYQAPLDNFMLSLFPDRVEIKDHAFERTALEVIRFGCQTTIGKSAFADTFSLLSVHFPLDGSCEMQVEAFANSNVSQVILPDPMDVIPEKAFVNSGVCLVHFPKQLVSVGAEAFAVTEKSRKGRLRFARLGNSLVKRIGEYAFCGQGMLQCIDFPASLEEIAPSAFSGCKSLDLISMEDQNNNRYFVENGNLYENLESGGTAIVRCPARMPHRCFRNDTVKVGAYAFADTHISHIDIPETVTSIEHHAFENALFLKDVVFQEMPFVGHHAFQDCNLLSKVTIGHLDTELDMKDVFGDVVPKEFVFVGTTSEQIENTIFPYGVPEADIMLFHNGKCRPYKVRGNELMLPGFSTEEFEYHIEIKGYVGILEDVVVPERVLFKPVTVLRKSTFEATAGRIRSIFLPPKIRIEHGSLEKLINLKEITIPRAAIKEIIPLMEHGILSKVIISE